MKNKFGLDMRRTYFVIDSMVSALMVSIISQGEPVHLIIEQKLNVDTDDFVLCLKQFIEKCINADSIEKMKLSPRFYINSWQLSKIVQMRYETKHIYDAYGDVVFIGAPTSTFIRCLPKGKNNIYFLYHGMTDCIRMEKELAAQKKIINRVKSLIIGKLIGLPNSSWCNYWSEKAFSLCNLKNDVAMPLNLYDFASEDIEKSMAFMDKFGNDKKNVLFFPIDSGHTADGVQGDTTVFDSVNVMFLEKHIDKDRDRVFIKYHPWLYRTKNRIKSDFVSVLQKSGIEAYDIGEMIPVEIGGPTVPTEVLCRYFHFDKLIAQDTSTIWYLGNDNSVKKILDISFADKVMREKLRECYRDMRKKSITETIEIYDE